jgi:predicted Co/Zn/Cd cation transporter (cation efflux family)
MEGPEYLGWQGEQPEHVFDGPYSSFSIGLSVLAMLALRFSRRGADARFHGEVTRPNRS